MQPDPRTPNPESRTPSSGFTLIETVIALLIVSLALVPIVGSGRGTLALMTEGRVQARMALTMGGQLDRARLEAGLSCAAVPSASGLHNGVSYWRSVTPGLAGLVTASVSADLPRRTMYDTLSLDVGCP